MEYNAKMKRMMAAKPSWLKCGVKLTNSLIAFWLDAVVGAGGGSIR